MNKLEDELNAARQEYESLQYPGDLASEMAPGRSHRWRWAVAVAAAIVLLMIIVPHADEPGSNVGNGSMTGTSMTANVTLSDIDVPVMPSFSFGGMPSTAAASISIPSIGSALDVSLDLSSVREFLHELAETHKESEL